MFNVSIFCYKPPTPHLISTANHKDDKVPFTGKGKFVPYCQQSTTKQTPCKVIVFSTSTQTGICSIVVNE